MKLVQSLALVVALASPAAVFACEGHNQTAAKQSVQEVKQVTVTQLAELNKAHKAVILDANGEETRAKWGVIPDAKLLTNYASYDVSKELPSAKDSKLVFYCANTKCSASHAAAKKALEAGYTDVNVLPDGIKGWTEAGQAVQALHRS